MFTSTSTGPYASRAAFTSRSHSSGSEMFTATGVASPPAARISSTVRSSEPSSGWSPSRRVRAAQTTRPPSAANVRAISAPMPRLAPVTMTALPSSLPIVPLLARYGVRRSMSTNATFFGTASWSWGATRTPWARRSCSITGSSV